jgi:hypothetical protein
MDGGLITLGEPMFKNIRESPNKKDLTTKENFSKLSIR